MTNENQPSQDDPRFAYAKVTETLGQLITSIEEKPAGTLEARTPCPEYSVADMLDHIMMVVRRVAVIGNGGHFSEVQQESLGSGWSAAYQATAHDIMEAWTDPAKLEQMFEVPWGQFPGAPVLIAYTGELAVHGWDLSQATGVPFVVEDDLLQGALFGAKFIPAGGRESEEVPFGPVVDPGPDASVLDQLAGWMGRKVA